VINGVAYRKIRISESVFAEHERRLNPQRVLYIYLALYFVANIAGNFARGGALRQVFINIVLLKWVGYVLLGYICVPNKVYRKYIIAAFFLEFASGFFSYFSSFKDVFFYSAIVLVTYVRKVNTKVVVKGAILGSLSPFCRCPLDCRESEYREFLNQGSKTQTVQVSQSVAFDKLAELVSNVDGDVWIKLLSHFITGFSMSFTWLEVWIWYHQKYLFRMGQCGRKI